MEISRFENYDQLSIRAAEITLTQIESKNDLFICAATGNSPFGLYQNLHAMARKRGVDFSKIRLVKLDEWGGLQPNDPATCEFYLRKHLINPLGIPEENYISFDTDPQDPEVECEVIQSKIDQHGPIDLCILGLGKNGHIGFIEPGPELELHCHKAELSTESMEHSMLNSTRKTPEFGLTMGIGDILASERVLLLVTGEGKNQVVDQLMEKRISTYLPASFLWLHDQVDCLMDVNT